MTELADDPLAPPACRRRSRRCAASSSWRGWSRRLVAAEPGLAAGTAVFDLADSLGDLLDEMQGEGVPPDALRRASTPASMPRTGSAACASST